MTSTVFRLPADAIAKADPAVIGEDERRLRRIADRLAEQVARTREELDATRRITDLRGASGVERDLEVRRLDARLATLSRFGSDVVLGRIDHADGGSVYIGRIGVTEDDGSTLLLDWRTPDAAPFFAATLADPCGLVNRRHFRWAQGHVVDFWDERFTGDDLGGAALDAQSAFLASLGASRSATMQSVLGTIASDQDEAIRASSRGVLLVDGGPGTGKTVVALHRAVYLLYIDPRLQGSRGRILIVGPHRPYLAYISDVLPSLGEEGVTACTIAEMVPGGERAIAETDSRVSAVKRTVAAVDAVESAVAFYEEPPREGTDIETDDGVYWLSPSDWAEAMAAVGPRPLHNEVREDVLDALVDILVDGRDADVDADRLRADLRRNADLRRELARVWPLVEHEDLVADLWRVPAYLRRCMPHLTEEEARLCRGDETATWTVDDLPLLDAARRRLGDSAATRRVSRARRDAADRRRVMDSVVDDLIEAADDGGSLATMLRAEDIQSVIVDEAGLPTTEPDALAGPFAHIVVDEAQELTDAQWRMLAERCPSGSMTVVGDRAQARDGFTESWTDRLQRVGLAHIVEKTLTVNYRTPEEIMALAGPTVRAALPDVTVPTSVRSSGIPVGYGDVADLEATLDEWTAANDGTVCVIGATDLPDRPRVRSLSPTDAKGLEFDLVVLVDPGAFGDGVTGAVDRYVAMTRSTRELRILHRHPRTSSLESDHGLHHAQT